MFLTGGPSPCSICSFLYEHFLWFSMQALVNLILTHPQLAAFGILICLAWLWQFWTFRIRPLLIAKKDIHAEVDELIAKYGPRAEEMAFIREDRAWRYSDTFEQGKWRRVRRELWRRYRMGEWE